MQRSYALRRRSNPELAFRLRQRAQIVVRAIRRFAISPGGLSILDLGCAEGAALREINRLLPGNRFCGLELSDDLLRESGPMPPNMELRHGDVTAPPPDIPRNAFHVVSALAILEHLPNPDVALARAVELLKPGGLLVATCPVPFWDRASDLFRLHNADGHACELDRKGMTRLATAAGLEILGVDLFMWAPVAILPYAGIRLSPAVALDLDERIRAMKLFNGLFVNQALVARKPQA